MLEWINQTIGTADLSFIMIIAILLLGALTSVSSGCNIAILGALTGYAGIKKNNTKYDSLFTSLGFMLGTILIMTLAGALIGYAGEVISKTLSLYGKIFAGFVTIFFGLLRVAGKKGAVEAERPYKVAVRGKRISKRR